MCCDVSLCYRGISSFNLWEPLNKAFYVVFWQFALVHRFKVEPGLLKPAHFL